MFRLFKSSQKTSPNPLNLPTEVKSLSSPYANLMYGETSTTLYRALSPEALIKNYATISPLYTAVTRIANSVASLPITIHDPKTHEEFPTHPALKRLSYPNPYQQKTKHEYLRDLIIWKLLTGNTYLLSTGNPSRPPLELNLLNPLNITLMSTDQQLHGGYPDTIQYTPHLDTPPTTYRKPQTPSDPFYYSDNSQQSVYHIMSFNPDYGVGDYEGAPELSALYHEVNHWVFSSQHNLSLLQNGARPSGAFVLKSRDGQPAMLSEEQFSRLKEQINKNYQGAANAGRPLILEGGLEWSEMQLTPRDLDFATMKQRSEEAIYKVLGIPLQLIMADSVTANNLSNFRLEFYENRILPLADELCTHLNRFILARYPDSDNLSFTVDRDEIDVLLPSRIEKRRSIDQSLSLTIDEKRQRNWKLPNLPHGNKITDPNGRPIAGEDVPEEEIIAAPPSAPPSAPE